MTAPRVALYISIVRLRKVLLPLAAVGGFFFARYHVPPPRTIEPRPLPALPAASVAPPASAPTPSAPEPPKPIHDRLSRALDSRQPLETAARTLAIIEAMTVEDFRQLGDRPGGVPAPSAYGFDREFCDAYVNALVERWFTVDPAGAFAGIQALEKKMIIKPGRVWAGSGEFFSAVARLHPALLLDSLPEKAVWDFANRSVTTAFKTLAQRDPTAARRYLARFPDPEQRKFAEIAIAQGIAENDPLAGVALARALDNAAVFESALAVAKRRGPAAVREVLLANGQKFPLGYSLPELVLLDPDENWAAVAGDSPAGERGILIQTMAEAARLTPEERDRRLAALDRLPPNLREQMRGLLISAWANDDPRAALEWTLAHIDADHSDSATGPFSQWLRADRDAAIAWYKKLPSSPMHDGLTNLAASTLASAGAIDEAIALIQPMSKSRAPAIAAIASAHGQNDPAAAAAWLDSLPPDIDTTSAAKAIVQNWTPRDPANAAAWIEAQPAGPRREAALQAYTQAAVELDAPAAGAWVETIADEKARAKAAEFVFRQWNYRNPAAAHAWLGGLPDIDPVLRDRIMRLGR